MYYHSLHIGFKPALPSITLYFEPDFNLLSGGGDGTTEVLFNNSLSDGELDNL